MTSGKFYLTANCVCSTAKSIDEMKDQAVEITYRSFAKHCVLGDFLHYHGYCTRTRSTGLRLQDDGCVTYFKSWYRGKPCYYLKHSAIEYIWT